MQNMKQTIRFILLLSVLLMSAVGEIRAIESSNIIFSYDDTKGTASLKSDGLETVVGGTKVTIIVTPNDGYSVSEKTILVEKMVDPTNKAPRRTPGLSGDLEVNSGNAANEYYFVIPTGYDGAYVTVNFYKKIQGFTQISSLDQIPKTQEGLAGNYQLIADVSGVSTSLGEFTGTLEGGYHTIYGLSAPLFTTINGGTVKNLMLREVTISQDGPVGAIAGTASGYTRIYNCGILPNMNIYTAQSETSYLQSSGGTNSYCGGLVGWLKDDSRVINCFSYANIKGGADVAGIVGHNEAGSTTAVTAGKYAELRTAVVNCMFYGNITGGSHRYPVYGGAKMLNNTTTGINNYDFYRAESNINPTDYNCSWPAKEEYLTKYEFYRNLLNSNRELCGWWVGAASAPSEMTTAQVKAVPKDASLMAKWVLDPSIAPYPILKPAGKYFSVVNQDPNNRVNPTDKNWVSRSTSSNTIMTKAAPDTEGQKLGSVTVTINKGGGLNGSDSKSIPITAMDIENNDFCYGKIQLPYYNSIFGNPNSNDWDEKYGGNYKDKVVVGWTVSASGGIANVSNQGEHAFSTDAESGYNFADRYCTTKDENRVFAQGGYYYVPYGVTEITITAKWATATYLSSKDCYYDRISVSTVGSQNPPIATSTLYAFEPAGQRPKTLGNGKTDQSGYITSYVPDGSVYEKAIVLVGNHQQFVGNNSIGSGTKGCTIMSADFDMDEEPDYCLVWELGTGTNRYNMCPVRFDFLPVAEMGLAMKEDGSTQYYALGCYRPLGHFEVTETALIRFGQFEYGNSARTTNAPLVLNGGIFDQYTKGTKAKTTADDNIDYVILGGHVRMPSFTPGAHVNASAKHPTRHCPVNVMGGHIDNIYLTGNYNDNVTPNKDNPHCYIDGGRFKQIAAAGKEGVDGNVCFKIDHSEIGEFYGGSTMDQSTGNNFKTVKGNIDVTIDNSMVTKYCGGPKFGSMESGKTVTTRATGTTFGVYYGGGNGGTSYVQYASTDVTENNYNGNYSWTDGSKGKLGSYTAGKYRNGNKNYMANYEMEIVNPSTGSVPRQAIFRTYFYAAQFSATNTGSITNGLTDCKVLTNFYGGGNLGGVKGDVTSTLSGNTRVEGSVFGAGYSASIPEVTIYNKDKTAPTINVNTGIIMPTPEGSGTSTTYTWTNKTEINGQNLSTASPTATDTDGEKYFYTEEPLTNLGSVSGTVTLTIEGSTSVGGSVFGGGEESGVDGNTEVKVTGGTIGTKKEDGTVLGGAEYGNVYGGGKGKEDNETAGLVKGNTNVIIQNTTEGETTIIPTIYHNVYGGGAYGSVGTFTYNATTGLPETWNTENDKGKCTVTITGGTIGTDGHENGMVFGSSRGDVGQPGGITDKQAWVHQTQVTIGDATLETAPTIKGSVYGGGENGHTFTDALVEIKKGTIGITDTSVDGGARYPYRGNVYGGGCGTDTYTQTVGEGNAAKTYTYYNRLAGIVEGNTTVNISGGHVVHNVYGGGAMGSVGVFTRDANTATAPHIPGKITGVTSGGKCTVTVSGGMVGNYGAQMTATGGPDDFGHVFGAGRGEIHDLADYPNLERVIYVNNTDVTISGGLVTGSVYGGSESGHVLGNTNVAVSGGQIGCSIGDKKVYEDSDFDKPSLDGTDHWDYDVQTAYPYDQYAGTTGYNAEGGATTATDGHTFYGNVFGGGSGYYPYAPGKWLRSAGRVEGTTTVEVSGGHVLNNVYGGCEMADVEGAASVTISGGTVGVPRLGTGQYGILANPSYGYVFGGGMGDKRIFFNTSTNVASTTVNVTGGKIFGSVYGGGEDGHVLGDAVTTISEADAAKPLVIGSVGTSEGYDGNVFGGGQGSTTALTAGVVGGDVKLTVTGGTMKGSVYGGGRIASVGTYFALATDPRYGKMQDDVADNPSTTEVNEKESHGHITVDLTGGTIWQNVYGGCMGTNAAANATADDIAFAAKLGVSKTVEVNLNEQCKGKDADNIGTASGCVVKGDIFGCNNTNGSPQQAVTVHVYGTQNAAKNDIATKFFKATADLDDMTTLSSLKENIAGLNAASEEAKTEQEKAYDTNLAAYNQQGATDEEKQTALANIKKIILFAIADELGLDISVDKTTLSNAEATAAQKQTALDNIKKAIGESKYDVHAVYGGGNLAAYTPITLPQPATDDQGKDTKFSTNVIIDGCGLTSIRYVYGGGNAASTPETNLTINGTYEIEEAFGGGNGKDKIKVNNVEKENPGANVGFYDYSSVETTYNTKDERQKKAFTDKYTYGSGKASVNIYGGTIHRVFGGSNTKGNVRITAVTMLEEKSTCAFCVDEAYGGGKSAPMDAEAKLHMACIPGLNAAYGGAEAADIQGNVTLNITNGTFDHVFGGNNLSGTIRGSITVNIEEVGCKPIIIGELYGGGNQAGYSIYGYDSYDKPKETGTKLYADPVVNVKSFTSIGTIYGGGYGTGAIMVGSPTVNINEVVGTPETYPTDGDFNETGYKGKTKTIDGHDVVIPAHTKGKIGAINNVFGGGNAAEVKGNTNVNIGTETNVFVTVNDNDITVGTTDVSSYYTRSGEGTTTSPYVYTKGSEGDKAVANTTYYEEKPVIGVDIRGNVYGGGNNAAVTGNTNVTIGKRNE